MDCLKPDAIKAVVQRSLLSWWERARHARACPPIESLADEDIDWARPGVLIYAVEHRPNGVDYRALHHGHELHDLYDGDVTGTSLSDHIIPEHRAPMLAAYEAACRLKRPIYSIRATVDRRDIPVFIETLRLPMARPDGEVAQVMTSVVAISSEGAFDQAHVQLEARTGAYRAMGYVEPPMRSPGEDGDGAVETVDLADGDAIS
jgi:hypothetical protein